jgi:hypothetical protein
MCDTRTWASTCILPSGTQSCTPLLVFSRWKGVKAIMCSSFPSDRIDLIASSKGFRTASSVPV